MLSEKNLREIKECDQVGINVVVVDNEGALNYTTQGLGGSEYCDQCSSFRLLPDPDPYDWFRSGDKKAVCLEVNAVIESALEMPSEWINIQRPRYCPKLNCELSKEEKVGIDRMLRRAQKKME